MIITIIHGVPKHGIVLCCAIPTFCTDLPSTPEPYGDISKIGIQLPATEERRAYDVASTRNTNKFNKKRKKSIGIALTMPELAVTCESVSSVVQNSMNIRTHLSPLHNQSKSSV
jgi:hypothetical protein